MEPISIELTISSGKDLRAFNFFQKLAIYATVWIGDSKKKHKTQPDRENGSNPEWKHELKLDLDRTSHLEQSLQFHLHTDWVFGDRIIGEVHVPVKDLIGDFNGGLRFVSYQVKDPNGKPNGTLNFAYKINNLNVAKDNEGFLAGLSGTGDVSFPANLVDDFPSFYPSIENTQEIFPSPVLTQTSFPPATAGYPPPASYPPPQEPYYCHPPPPLQHCHHPPPPPPHCSYPPPPPPHEYFPPPQVGYFPPPPPPPGPPGPYGYMQPGYPYPQFGH